MMDTLLGSLIGICVGGGPFFLMLVGVLIGWWVLSGKPNADARAMKNKFHQLGTLTGKSLDDIKKVVGEPKSFVALGDHVNYSWNTQKYHVTLIFKDNICQGVSSEISV